MRTANVRSLMLPMMEGSFLFPSEWSEWTEWLAAGLHARNR